jgi:hypothetical protein
MRMIWKSTTKVGFATRDKVVVAWYCEVPPAITEASKAKLNIGKYCIDTADGATKGRNTCYNKIALDAVNAHRKAHAVAEVAEDPEMAAKLQTAVNALAEGADLADEADCTTIYYEEGDEKNLAKLAGTDLAVK